MEAEGVFKKWAFQLYYGAKRNYLLTNEENSIINKIIEKYNKDKKFKKGEDFYIYEYEKKEPEKIFSGSTGLPMSILDPMLTAKGCIYWAQCLIEIKNIVKDAEWSVQMDETESLCERRSKISVYFSRHLIHFLPYAIMGYEYNFMGNKGILNDRHKYQQPFLW
ncbi:hypothetical protein FACS1894172_04400 [Spirochaetia bacterium]|nr:hypothetical protein FACS1894172_04400 [Spirochaetia bacterium]